MLEDNDLLRSHAYVDGRWVEANCERCFDVINPADGSLITTVPDLDAVDTSVAIDAAARALPDWRDRTAKDRGAILRRWFELILENQQDLALLMTLEQGKPLAEARGEISYAASFVEWFSEEGKRVYGDVIPSPVKGKRLIVIKQPVGVIAAITPWNFPAAMITRKVAPALAVGCTAVVKPAEDTPLSALALAELLHRAGAPPGVFNVVTSIDPSTVGAELTGNPLVRKLSFTGSTAVGKLLMSQAAQTIKKVSLELGGNAPFIVFDDANLDAAVAGVLVNKYRNAGQTCICANRILVQDAVYDSFTAKLTAAVRAITVGKGADQGVTMGPLINLQAIEKVEALVETALAGGAKAAVGGSRHELGGLFYQPTVMTDVLMNMDIANQEIFGPVAPLYRFESEQEAIQLANDTPYGLAAYFYTRDLGRAWRVAEGLEYGMVGVNESIISNEVAPFGGCKESGIGREGSKYGIEEFVDIKYLMMGGLDRD
jgi:succinate-semialdehyde dehydrogenase/glutarate-semialdehyde dehydrogenase